MPSYQYALGFGWSVGGSAGGVGIIQGVNYVNSSGYSGVNITVGVTIGTTMVQGLGAQASGSYTAAKDLKKDEKKKVAGFLGIALNELNYRAINIRSEIQSLTTANQIIDSDISDLNMKLLDMSLDADQITNFKTQIQELENKKKSNITEIGQKEKELSENMTQTEMGNKAILNLEKK